MVQKIQAFSSSIRRRKEVVAHSLKGRRLQVLICHSTFDTHDNGHFCEMSP